ncbi:hypothetical protein [Labrys monachus]|uniref:Uncharacterized protein n=1 Tax=Labrys monachus TaxID=217067 RepID=A0ABU0FBV2_9HYPH|nr:hypothetical protein [Labrys monachus]MDQ0391802.1 hypothetical protein [Labrys monachus]
MQDIFVNLIGKVAHNTVALLITLFVLAGLSAVSKYENWTVLQTPLDYLNGVIVSQANTVVVSNPSSTVVVSGTVVSPTAQ